MYTMNEIGQDYTFSVALEYQLSIGIWLVAVMKVNKFY